MRDSLIAITVSAAIAGAFVILTEPVISAQGGLPKSAAKNTSKPAIKGDRLDRCRAGNCLFSDGSVSERNNCPLRPAQPDRHPFQDLTVIVSLWPTAFRSPKLIADA
jgi:hypothetical protein